MDAERVIWVKLVAYNPFQSIPLLNLALAELVLYVPAAGYSFAMQVIPLTNHGPDTQLVPLLMECRWLSAFGSSLRTFDQSQVEPGLI